MKLVAEELETIVDQYKRLLTTLDANELSVKPSAERWSKKEMIGHLIDSAQNNIRRFIVAQYEENPAITYDQDKWVNINNYQQSDASYLIDLWYLLNKQVVSILLNTTGDMISRTCFTKDIHSIEWLAKDYIKHLKHHMHVVLDLEPVAYP